MKLFCWHKWHKVGSTIQKNFWGEEFINYTTLIRYECEKCKHSKVQEIQGC